MNLDKKHSKKKQKRDVSDEEEEEKEKEGEEEGREDEDIISAVKPNPRTLHTIYLKCRLTSLALC
jgi:hypothetical protein